MENAKGKKQKSPKKSGERQKASKSQPIPTEEKHGAAGEPSKQRTSGVETKRKRSKEDDKACPQKMAQENKRVRIHKKIPIPPLPLHLPPVNLIHRDVVRGWCQQLKLSTSGQKWETYNRLRAYAYPNQKAIPIKPEEAKILTLTQRKLKMQKGEMSLDSLGLPELTGPLVGGPAPDGGATALLERMDNIFVTTSTPDDVFASWSRIAATTGKSGKMENVRSPQEASGKPHIKAGSGSGYKWCVVHGQSLPADTEGWVQLQFYAGQAWVPEKPGQVCALFLIPSCNFPPPHLEDNMLCPKCIHRNKVLARSFHCQEKEYDYDCN